MTADRAEPYSFANLPSDETVATLRAGSLAHGDEHMAGICDRALAGDIDCTVIVMTVLNSSTAQP